MKLGTEEEQKCFGQGRAALLADVLNSRWSLNVQVNPEFTQWRLKLKEAKHWSTGMQSGFDAVWPWVSGSLITTLLSPLFDRFLPRQGQDADNGLESTSYLTGKITNF